MASLRRVRSIREQFWKVCCCQTVKVSWPWKRNFSSDLWAVLGTGLCCLVQQPSPNEKWTFHQPALGGCTLLSFKKDTSPTLGLMDATVHIPAVRMPGYSIWLSSLKDLAQHPNFPVSLELLAAGKAGVSGGLEGQGDGKCSHSATVAVSVPLGKEMLIPAPSVSFPWPLLVSFLLRPVWQGSWWHCSHSVGHLLAVLWWWWIRQRPSRLDWGRKKRNNLYLLHCSQRHLSASLVGLVLVTSSTCTLSVSKQHDGSLCKTQKDKTYM